MTMLVRCYPDVFLDVGSGVDNVLAQVALTTNVRTCIGTELRRELVLLKQVDVGDVSMSRHSPLCEATIVFANIFLFEEDAKLIVSRELSAMPEAWVIVSTSLFGPRHRSPWKATPQSIYIYRNKL
ncbi:uncharacterized protein PITG_20991 [Phytophthora infestans T30-4]|uniref:DOT1 domain-containing protein n=1 Tax=Phytophthora infestans (strain T30-4) TaxID=403677 RepID=D0P3C5_PHYIT|nr:uncharacterized protein PITG_20991 [Phytophthora infestans T30-4]EEY59313.1 conserved hypothetical protein [Phytophthora infestans T30-4]|eukprot:XP_002895208.1 conserved hypothetical protein [Phytophthora infestans T30-4]